MKRAFGMAITGLAGGLWLKTLVLAVALSSFGVSHAQFLRQPRGPRQVVKSGLLQKPDSAAIARRDSILVAGLVDSLLKLPTDSLPSVSDSIRLMLPDTIRQTIFPDSLQKDTVALTEKQLRRQQRRENRKPLLSDSMALRKVCWASLVLPGFGQIYNKQYWKLPILYGTFGASLGMFIHENNKYKPLKKQFDAYMQSMLPSYEVQNPNCEGSEENAKDFMEFGQFLDSKQSGLGAIVDKLSGVVNGMKSFDCTAWRQLRQDAGNELRENLKKY